MKCRFGVLVLFALLGVECFVLSNAFVLPLTSQQQRRQVSVLPRYVANPKTKAPSSSSITVKEASNELLSLLVERRKQKNGRASAADDKTKRIELLIHVLVDQKVSFDPTECLNPPLYIVCYRQGPEPLWEKVGMLVRQDIQGQQYKYEDGEKSVINYAEILGKALHIRAYGTYKKDDSSSDNEKSASSPLNGVLSIFNARKGDSSSSSSMPTCPADYTVTVTKGSICFSNNVCFDIPIAGTGYQRVLYADPRLRIFTSPKSTTDDRWEKEGLVVVQVRSDLLDTLVEL